jgi:hypothetical protein
MRDLPGEQDRVSGVFGDGLLALGPAHDDPCYRRAGDERQSFLPPDVMQITSRLERICDPKAEFAYCEKHAKLWSRMNSVT